MNEFERFLNSEIERLKDELSHLQRDHKKMLKNSIDSFTVLAAKIKSGDNSQDSAEIMTETINVILKNGENSGKIIEVKKMIKRFTSILQTIKKDKE